MSQNEFAARLNDMEAERQNLAEAVTLAERKYSDEKRRVDELQQQVKVFKSNLESSKQELIDYKQKATRILQVSLRCTLWMLGFASWETLFDSTLICERICSCLAGLAHVRCLTQRFCKRLRCRLFQPPFFLLKIHSATAQARPATCRLNHGYTDDRC